MRYEKYSGISIIPRYRCPLYHWRKHLVGASVRSMNLKTFWNFGESSQSDSKLPRLAVSAQLLWKGERNFSGKKPGTEGRNISTVPYQSYIFTPTTPLTSVDFSFEVGPTVNRLEDSLRDFCSGSQEYTQLFTELPQLLLMRGKFVEYNVRTERMETVSGIVARISVWNSWFNIISILVILNIPRSWTGENIRRLVLPTQYTDYTGGFNLLIPAFAKLT